VRLEPNNAGAHGSLARAYWMGKGMIEEAIVSWSTHGGDQSSGRLLVSSTCFLAHADRQLHSRGSCLPNRRSRLQEKYISGKEGLQVVGAHNVGFVVLLLSPGPLRRKAIAVILTRSWSFSTRAIMRCATARSRNSNRKLGAAHLRKG